MGKVRGLYVSWVKLAVGGVRGGTSELHSDMVLFNRSVSGGIRATVICHRHRREREEKEEEEEDG